MKGEVQFLAWLQEIKARNAVMKFGAVELGQQMVEKLAAYVERQGRSTC